jgi:hypothetical protein
MSPSERPGDLLSYQEVAKLAKVSAATLRGYRAAQRMPEPDELPAPDRPRWRRDTIETWLRTRPGRGHVARKVVVEPPE